MTENVTGIMVCYNTAELVKRAYESVRQFYPEMLMIIVNNSDKHDTCTAYVNSIKSTKTKVINVYENIGHGPGMHMGIGRTKTKYALLFDSDIDLKSDCLNMMISQMKDDSFGVGQIQYVDNNGYNINKYYSKARKDKSEPKIPYLHPHFHLINVKNYRKFKLYADHGAPCIETMKDIFNQRLSDKILINFPVGKYVQHDWRGTRSIIDRRYRRKWKSNRIWQS